MNSNEDSKENILNDKRKIEKITTYIDEHKEIIAQEIQTQVKFALSKIELDMNKITLERITEVVEVVEQEEICQQEMCMMQIT